MTPLAGFERRVLSRAIRAHDVRSEVLAVHHAVVVGRVEKHEAQPVPPVLLPGDHHSVSRRLPPVVGPKPKHVAEVDEERGGGVGGGVGRRRRVDPSVASLGPHLQPLRSPFEREHGHVRGIGVGFHPLRLARVPVAARHGRVSQGDEVGDVFVALVAEEIGVSAERDGEDAEESRDERLHRLVIRHVGVAEVRGGGWPTVVVAEVQAGLRVVAAVVRIGGIDAVDASARELLVHGGGTDGVVASPDGDVALLEVRRGHLLLQRALEERTSGGHREAQGVLGHAVVHQLEEAHGLARATNIRHHARGRRGVLPFETGDVDRRHLQTRTRRAFHARRRHPNNPRAPLRVRGVQRRGERVREAMNLPRTTTTTTTTTSAPRDENWIVFAKASRRARVFGQTVGNESLSRPRTSPPLRSSPLSLSACPSCRSRACR